MVKKFVKIFPHDYKKVMGLSSKMNTKEEITSAAIKEEING
jgi:hypothetical protein